MLSLDQNIINQHIEERICKTTIQKNIGKKILMVVNQFNHSMQQMEASLAEHGYTVTVEISSYITSCHLFKNINLIYVDCSENFLLLDSVVKTKQANVLVVAIMNDDMESTDAVFSKHAYDYIKASISPTELLHRTNLYLLYSAACSLQVFEDFCTQSWNRLNSSKEQKLVNQVCQYLLDNMHKYTSLDDLCRMLGTNRNTLAAAFKNQLGMGVYAWLRKVRVLKATKLLKWSDLSIQSICFEVGYENAGNFLTTFKSIIGMTPKAYRNLHNQNFQ